MTLEKLAILIDLELIEAEERIMSATDFNNNNEFIKRYIKGYISGLSTIQLSFNILNILSLQAIKEFAGKQWVANYEKQKEIVGEHNDTGKPHLEGCYYQGKLECYKFIQSVIK